MIFLLLISFFFFFFCYFQTGPMLLMDDTWKSNNGVHSESPSPVPSLINISNTSISLSSIEPPSHPTTNINLEMYERTTVSASSALSSNFGSFTFDFESINLDNDFQIDIPTITNSVVGGNDDSFKEPKSIERLFFGLFKHKDEVIQLDEDEATRTQVFGEKQVRRKHSLACLNFFKKEDCNNQCNKLQTAHYPKKSILKSKINQNYTIEQSQTKLDDSLSFSQFMDKFEHVESEKIGNEQRLSKLRLKQLRGYYSQLNGS